MDIRILRYSLICCLVSQALTNALRLLTISGDSVILIAMVYLTLTYAIGIIALYAFHKITKDTLIQLLFIGIVTQCLVNVHAGFIFVLMYLLVEGIMMLSIFYLCLKGIDYLEKNE